MWVQRGNLRPPVNDFATERWREILALNGLDGFEDLWNLAHTWVEPPNTRHGGFGAVARHDLVAPEGGRRTFYVKIHRNRLRFLRAYLGIERLTPRAKRLWRRVAAASEAKRRRRAQASSKLR
jgi:hypothetical protein